MKPRVVDLWLEEGKNGELIMHATFVRRDEAEFFQRVMLVVRRATAQITTRGKFYEVILTPGIHKRG